MMLFGWRSAPELPGAPGVIVSAGVRGAAGWTPEKVGPKYGGGNPIEPGAPTDQGFRPSSAINLTALRNSTRPRPF
jgi:hypothetical protein